MTQDLAQGACQALEDAVTLGAAIEAADGDYSVAFYLYEKARVPRTARVLYSAREMGRVYHAKGVERLVRNELWRSEEHTSELQSLMRISYAVFCLKKKKQEKVYIASSS